MSTETDGQVQIIHGLWHSIDTVTDHTIKDAATAWATIQTYLTKKADKDNEGDREDDSD